jgi:phospholipid transport system substrate-binding protein
MAAAVGAGRATAEDTPTAAPAEGPVAVIERLHAGLLKVLEQAKRLDYRARYERIGPAIDAAYDLPFMAEKVIGRQWKDLDDGARARWIQTFGRLTKATYAARFDDYGGQRFETLGEERGAYDTVMVRSRVVDPAAENVDLTYRLRNGAAGWKIVDVYLKGTVSELALRRSEYTAILGRGGMAGLFKEVDETIARLAEGTAVTP